MRVDIGKAITSRRIGNKDMRRLAGWLGALLVSFSPVAASMADAPWDRWQKVCFDTRLPEKASGHKEGQQTRAGDNGKLPICYTYTYIALFDLIGGRLGVVEVQGREKLLLVAEWIDYLSLDLSYIQIDGKPPIDLIRGSCEERICFAKAESGATLIEQLKTATGLSAGNRKWKNQSLLVPHRGFAEAFEGAPKHNESDPDLKDMREAVVRMLAE
jgi:hypothetical protein